MAKKVLHIIPRFTAGGAEQLLLEYTREIFVKQNDADGSLVAVVSVRGGGPLMQEFRGAGATVLEVKNIPQVIDFVKTWQPDIVHTHIMSGDIAGYWIKKKFPRIPWISTQHNVESHASWPRRFAWRQVLKHADAIIAVSHAVEAWCKEGWKIEATRIKRIQNCIPLAPWLAVPPLHIDGRRISFATVGRLAPQKGHIILLQALAELQEYPWELHVFGEGELSTRLQEEAIALQIGNRVQWHGVVRDMPKQLASVDIVVQPSLWEGRSLAVMEAFVAGRCVIASTAAGAELVQNGKTGIVVPVGDRDALAVAICRLLANPDEAVRLGANARMYAQERFGFDAWMREIQALYDSV